MVINYFKSLADETRLRLLNILIKSELSVNEIVSVMDMGQSRISRHLKIMLDSGLITCRRDGIWAFYSAQSSGEVRRFLSGISFLFETEDIFLNDLERTEAVIKDRIKISQNFFNEIASEWNRLKTEITGDFDVEAAILEFVGRSKMAVDLGCGTGEFLLKLMEKTEFAIGVDSSPKMLEEARKLFKNTNGCVNLRLGELEHLPLSDSEADLAVISMVLHHLSNPKEVIKEVSRVLMKDGVLIIADFEKHSNENLRDKYGDRWLGFSKNEIRDFLNGNFAIEEYKTRRVHQSLTLAIYKAIRL